MHIAHQSISPLAIGRDPSPWRCQQSTTLKGLVRNLLEYLIICGFFSLIPSNLFSSGVCSGLSSLPHRLSVFFYSLNGSRISPGVPLLDFLCSDPVAAAVGSTDAFRGVCIPDGVEAPLAVRLW